MTVGSASAFLNDSGFANARMTRDRVKEILDRVSTWPAERQADVAHVVEIMEEQDKSKVRLTDEQVAEVRRRIVEKNPKTLTLAEFNERLRHLCARQERHETNLKRILGPMESHTVMAGLVPAIYVLAVPWKTWMRGTSPRMTWIQMSGGPFAKAAGAAAL
jgi:hypothetical protein